MSDGFAEMIARANGFFAELAANNSKDFFEPRKEFYRDEIRKPAELLGDLMAEDIARHTGQPHGPKVFRIHRDVRFSKDKTPYNAHLNILWARPGEGVTPAWFFGSAPDYIILGMGVMGLDGDALAAYRNLVDRQGDILTDAMALAEAKTGARLSDWGPDPLKRVPKPFDADHPHADLLRRKSFALSADLPEDWAQQGLLSTLNAMIPAFLPTWRLLEKTFPG